VNYPATLRELWAQHQAPRAGDAPTMVSLFAGCGGSSLGYSAAGFRELLAAEWDHKACEVFAANLPGVRVFQGDVRELNPAMLEHKIFLLAASPPCQGVSVTGKRRPGDPRNELWREVVRLADAWKPRYVVVENVKGLTLGSMRTTVFKPLCKELASIGYTVEARLVDAQFLGVPQRRERTIVIGARTPLDVPRTDADALPAFPVPSGRVRTVRDAWTGLDDPGESWVPAGASAVLAPLVSPGSAGDVALAARGGKPTRWNVKRLAWDRPGNTLVREVRRDGGQFLHPAENRTLGTRELSRLQSFPDEFNFCGLPYKDVHALIGNSVPPLMSRAIGRALLQP
jgi:DNA (cytosine-5)-methyltransferase 1